VHEAIAAPAGESLEERERARGLEAAIGRLDAMNRALLLLYLEERSYAEIGEILGISESNVGTKLARLRARIRGELTVENIT
jgi:RNA polymerase sigma-70 factor (ECF subfamily)